MSKRKISRALRSILRITVVSLTRGEKLYENLTRNIVKVVRILQKD